MSSQEQLYQDNVNDSPATKLKKKIKAKDALEQMEDLLKFMRDRDCLANMKKV